MLTLYRYKDNNKNKNIISLLEKKIKNLIDLFTKQVTLSNIFSGDLPKKLTEAASQASDKIFSEQNELQNALKLLAEVFEDVDVLKAFLDYLFTLKNSTLKVGGDQYKNIFKEMPNKDNEENKQFRQVSLLKDFELPS